MFQAIMALVSAPADEKTTQLQSHSEGKQSIETKRTAEKVQEVTTIDTELYKQSKTISFDVSKQIKEKYKTFTNFNYRTTLQDIKKSKKKKVEEETKVLNKDMLASLLAFTLNPVDQTSSKKKNIVIEELAGVKSERRERFINKAVNLVHVVKHYREKQNFKPSEEELYLMKGLTEIRDFTESYGMNNLDSVLKRIYKLMNEAVDLNEMRFLCLLILLTADICFQFKDLNRAFYFYNEARMFSAYSQLFALKGEALLQMAEICLECRFYSEAITFLKKSLQFAWKIKNVETQMLIYDLIGNCYYYQGDVKNANYFHTRFAQGEFENNQSAIKKISIEMMEDYQKYVSSLEKKNLTTLFLEYINIPISNTEIISPTTNQIFKKSYQNYDEGLSPRRKKTNKKFEFQDFPDVFIQIEKLLSLDRQFRTEIPNPDVQRNFVITQKYGKPRKNLLFEHSSEFHKITGMKPEKLNLQKLSVFSLQKRVDRLLSQRPNENWWCEMVDRIKKQQMQKVGQLKDRVRNSHYSYGKYPEERRRANSLKVQKVKRSFNKTLLDWIDPIKN